MANLNDLTFQIPDDFGDDIDYKIDYCFNLDGKTYASLIPAHTLSVGDTLLDAYLASFAFDENGPYVQGIEDDEEFERVMEYNNELRGA
jgi:hypothetical protein